MSFTVQQQQAIDAPGQVLVLAGAGTGKTRTMVARCIDRLFRKENPVDLNRILMVTFTEAAAAEMKQRIGSALRNKLEAEDKRDRVEEQIALLDTAKIGTLHSFALETIREFSHHLDLSTGLRVLSSEEALRLADSALSEIFDRHYENRHMSSSEMCRQIRQFGEGNDRPLRALILKIYQYVQSLPQPELWLDEQLERSGQSQATLWSEWLLNALPNWCTEWIDRMDTMTSDSQNLHSCCKSLEAILEDLKNSQPAQGRHADSKQLFATLTTHLNDALKSDFEWPRGQKTKFRTPFEGLFEELQFLNSLLGTSQSGLVSPLDEDWDRARHWNGCLLQLTQEFTHAYTRLKKQLEGVDFQDLEQLFLKLLYDSESGKPSPIAIEIQGRFDHVFVDEYQDINGAQDAIVRAVSRSSSQANLFIVGDVKQSIYRFRRANPDILKRYEKAWTDAEIGGTRVYLQSNFRSAPPLLEYVNDFCAHLATLTPGFQYGPNARLKPGQEARDSTVKPQDSFRSARIETHLFVKEAFKESDLSPLEREIHIVAQRIQQYVDTQTFFDAEEGVERAFRWSDFAILMRSITGKPQVVARVFAQYEIPVQAAEGNFFEFSEIADLLALLRVIDNPLQDIPLLALLRSPFFGFNDNELAIVRLAKPRGHFWHALSRFGSNPNHVIQQLADDETETEPFPRELLDSAYEKTQRLFICHRQWLHARKTHSTAALLEHILATGFYIEFTSSLAPSRSPRTNIQQLLQLIREFERQPDASLTHFLHWIDELIESGHPIEPIPEESHNAVQLMSIHKSKGLEFPVVFLPDLSKRFNFTDLSQRLIIDEQFGLCPILHLPNTPQTYPSLSHWLAQREHRKQLIDEEARLLYVALTRAREHLVLLGEASEKQLDESWSSTSGASSKANSYLNWLAPWILERDQQQSEASEESDRALEAAVILHHDIQTPQPEDTARNRNENDRLTDSLTRDEIESLNERLEWAYPFLGATTLRAKGSISAFDRLDAPPPLSLGQTATGARPQAQGKRAGIAYHRALQFLTPAEGARHQTVQKELRRLASEGILAADEIEQLDIDKIVSFWTSDTGKQIRSQFDRMHRELPFTARFTAHELHQMGFAVTDDSLSNKEPVILQGVVDLAVILREEIWILDFKSEQMTASEIDQRTQSHRAQLTVYKGALEKTYRRPVTHLWIHFLVPEMTVNLLDAPGKKIIQ